MTTDAAPATETRETSPMHIGEVAARTELSLRSLRHWDEVGLVRPSGRTHGGFRLYTEADVEKILLIRRMKPLGFTLEEMSAAMRDIEALQAAATPAPEKAAAHRRLAAVLAGAHQRRDKLALQLDMADEFIGLLSHELA
jgi:MerR family copper efflux transcriptional regulator